MRWLLAIMLLGLIAACEPEDPTPELLPTNVVLPSRTPTSTLPPTATHTPTPTATHTPMPTATHTPTPTATPIALSEIVFPAYFIPAGAPIPPEAVQVAPWPLDSVPVDALNDPEQIVNQVAVVDIHCQEPILSSALALRTLGTGYPEFETACPPLPDLSAPVALAEVVVAAQYIPVGRVISPEMVALRPWPQAAPGLIGNLSDVIGTTTRQAILREQPIRAAYIQDN